jgi:uncharacterized OsmC-like protein
MTQVSPNGTTAVAPEVKRLDVRFCAGQSYEVAVGRHRIVVDQPTDVGGEDAGPTPTELFVASLASCVAFYAGRYLSRHGVRPDGLGVAATFELSAGRPNRVAVIRLEVRVPEDLPADRRPALLAVVSHCTVHNSLTTPPDVTIDLV